MAGGPSHIDTFDPKPDAPANIRGEFKAIDTSVSGVRISEHFPKFAKLMKHAAILRGMSTQESNHKRATYHLHTGYQNRGGAVAFPSLGSLVAKELGKRDVPLPNFVTIGRAAQEAVSAGFLGPNYQPLGVLRIAGYEPGRSWLCRISPRHPDGGRGLDPREITARPPLLSLSSGGSRIRRPERRYGPGKRSAPVVPG